MARVKKKSAVLFYQIEDTENTEQALTAQDAILVTDLDFKIGVGDSEELNFADYEAGYNPEQDGNLTNQGSFNVPLVFSADPDIPPVQGRFFRSAGFDVAIDAVNDTVTYTATRGESIDSGTAHQRRKKTAADTLAYKTTGAKNTIGVEVTRGKSIFWSVNLVGTFHRPGELPLLAADTATQKAARAFALNGGTLRTATLGGHAICLQNFKNDNLGALDIGLSDYINCDSIEGEPVTSTGSISYADKDWVTDFNPFEIAESHEQIQEHALVIEYADNRGYVLTMSWAKVQLKTPEEVVVGKGDLGKQHAVRFLSPSVIAYKKEVV